MLALPLLLLSSASATRIFINQDASRGGSLAGRTAAFAGKVLRGRYELRELLRSNETKGAPRAVGPFPWGHAEESPLNSGRFSEPQPLGRGSFGDTWRAFDRHSGVEVAVKIFFQTHHERMEATYVTREDNILAHAAHEECELVQRMLSAESSYPAGKAHICRCLESHVFDQRDDDDVSFIVMELCGTTSLEDKIKELTSLKAPNRSYLPSIRKWVKGCLEAIAFMQGLDMPVEHTDLHEGNIMITDDNEAKLIDFGRAAFFDPEEGSEDVEDIGTLYGDMLCAPLLHTFAYSGYHGRRCSGDTMGIGDAQDWWVVHRAYHEEDEEQVSAAAMVSMMP